MQYSQIKTEKSVYVSVLQIALKTVIKEATILNLQRKH